MASSYKKRSDSELPAILKKLGAMTAAREAHLVELSLLRTLGPLLGVAATNLYHVDDKGEVTRVLFHYRTDIGADC